MHRLAQCLVLLAVACSGNGARTPPVVATELRAEPATFHPGAIVTLRPRFAAGEARIDPDVGAVQSGGAYQVGPATRDVTYTLTIRRGTQLETATLTVPFGYRERITELTPSATARTAHSAALLADGSILLAGGSSPGNQAWSTSETFTLTGGFVGAGDLSATRSDAPLLAWPDGRATLCAGRVNAPSFTVATRIETFDPATRQWTDAGNLRCGRLGHTLTPISNQAMLVVGGLATGGSPTDRDAEIFDRVTGVRQPLGEMSFRRTGHTATKTPAGAILIAGGRVTDSGALAATAEAFAADTEEFAPLGSLRHPRASHTAVAIGGERILLLGGDDDAGLVAPAEMYFVSLNRFVSTGAMTTPRFDAPAVLLADGCVLSAGGRLIDGRASDAVEVWSPITETWSPWGQRLPAPRAGHSLHALPDGRVVLLGGEDGSGFPVPTCWVLD